MSDILSQTFQTNAAIIDATKRPPAPWVRTYIAAQLAECIAVHTGTAGDYLCRTHAIDLDRVQEITDAAANRIILHTTWKDPRAARERMAILSAYFEDTLSGLAFCHPRGTGHGIAQSVAETGHAFIAAMQDAPDTKPGRKSQYLYAGYRANPFVTLDTVAALTYHAAKSMEHTGIPSIEPFSRAEDYVTRIHANGYRNMSPRDEEQRDRLAASLAGLRALSASMNALTANPQAARIFKDFAHIGTLVSVTKFFTANYAMPATATTSASAPSKVPENTAAVLAFRPRS